MARRGRLFAVEGGSASGKTTLVEAAAHRFGWRPLPEAFDRLDNAPSLDFGSPRELLELERALLAEEVRRYREARQLCEHGVTVLADTGFFGPLTYTRGLVELGLAPDSVMDRLARNVRSLVRAGRLGIPDLTVHLRTTVDERARRAKAGTRHHPPELFRRHEAVGRFERRFFEREFPAVQPDRLRSLRADVPASVLARRLGAIVEAVRPRRSSRGEALALLARLRRPPRGNRRTRVGPNR